MTRISKFIYFPESVTLDRLTPYALAIGSDKIAAVVLVVTTVAMVSLVYISSVLAFFAMMIGMLFILLSFLGKCYVINRLIFKQELMENSTDK